MFKLTILAAMIVALCVCQNIQFPEMANQRLDSDNIFERGPLFAPDRCPENQLLYPGDQKHDWICDCGPAYLYYPPKDACFLAYRQGPCPKGQHIILKEPEVVPKCVKNPCNQGFALNKGVCYELGKPNGPCKPFIEGGGIFDVNSTTLKVECLQGTDRLSLLTMGQERKCPPGSKRDHRGSCRENWNVKISDAEES